MSRDPFAAFRASRPDAFRVTFHAPAAAEPGEPLPTFAAARAWAEANAGTCTGYNIHDQWGSGAMFKRQGRRWTQARD